MVFILALLAAAAAVQLVLPRIAERRIAVRLAESGGSAQVLIRAVPALRLLRNGGQRITVRGRGLTIGLAPGRGEAATAAGPAEPGRRGRSGPGLSALDGFDEVDIELVDLLTGPFEVAAFVLERSGAGSYAMAVRGHTTAAELAGLGLEYLPQIPGTGLLSTVAGTAFGSRRIPVSLQIELLSDAAGMRVGTGGGTIAGYPAGPLATTIAAAVARRLEIVP